MKEIRRKGEDIPKEMKRKCLDEIIKFFKVERDETIGLIAAEEVLYLFLQQLGDVIYRQGIEDSKILLKNRFEDFQVDLDLLANK